MKKSAEFQLKRLAKLMAYILGHRPDEFGLVLEEDGFIRLKELHRAITEEEGWSYIRMSHLEEAARITERGIFEIREGKIRLLEVNADLLSEEPEPVEPPGLLYAAVRRKSYPHILQHGLRSGEKPFVSLAVTEELALRMGRRRDPQPVLLTIHAERAHREGIKFTRSRELIYLLDSVSAEYISGPPLEQVMSTLRDKPRKPARVAQTSDTRDAGIFPAKDHARASPEVKLPSYDPLRMAFEVKGQGKRKKTGEPDWKRQARQYRRQRRKG